MACKAHLSKYHANNLQTDDLEDDDIRVDGIRSPDVVFNSDDSDCAPEDTDGFTVPDHVTSYPDKPAPIPEKKALWSEVEEEEVDTAPDAVQRTPLRTALNPKARLYQPIVSWMPVPVAVPVPVYYPQSSAWDGQAKKAYKSVDKMTSIDHRPDNQCPFAYVVAAARSILKGFQHVEMVDVQEHEKGWYIAASFRNRYLRHCRHALGKARNAMVQAAAKCDRLLILGPQTASVEVTPNGLGFCVYMALVSEHGSVCPDLRAGGTCELGDACPHMHPTWQRSVEVTARLL
jgi:hypothetical protein